MPIYTFHVCSPYGNSFSFRTIELAYDSAAFAIAGTLLGEHLTCDHVDVFEGARPVVSRHREQPIIRPVEVSDLERGVR